MSARRRGPRTCFGGDVEMLVPAAQWLPSYVFFTDPTYATSNAVLVRKRDASGGGTT